MRFRSTDVEGLRNLQILISFANEAKGDHQHAPWRLISCSMKILRSMLCGPCHEISNPMSDEFVLFTFY